MKKKTAKKKTTGLRKRTERTSTQQGILNATQESIWLFSADGILRMANEIALKRFGKTEKEVIGKHVNELVPPDLARTRLAHLNDVVRTGKPVEFEDKRADILFQHMFSPVFDEQGKVTDVAIFSRDITEQRRAQNELERLLQEAQRRATELDAMFRVLPNLVSLHGPDGRYLRANQAVVDLFGFDPSTATREEIARRVQARFPDGTPLTPENMPSSRALKGEPARDVEYIITNERGEDHVLQVNALPLKRGEEVFGAVLSQLDITERKRAEEQLAEAARVLEQERDTLQTIMNGAKNVHLVYLDRSFNFVRVNEAYATTCGYRPEEMIGKNHFALYPNAENEAIFARVWDAGEAFEIHDKPFEFPDQPERGTTYWDWSLTPVKAPGGEVIGLVFSLRETTERKRAEQEMSESAETFKKMFSGNAAAMVLSRLDGTILDVNDRWLKMTGCRRDQIVGKTSRLLWKNPGDRAALIREVREHGAVLGREYQVLRENGEEFTALFFAQAITIHGQQALISSAIDITERKKHEAQLAKQAQLLDLSYDAICVRDEQDRIAYWNDSAIRMYGYTREEGLGKITHELLCTIFPEPLKNIEEKLHRDGHWSGELVHSRRDGSKIIISSRWVLTHDGQGNASILETNTDITERRKADEALRQSNEELTRFNRAMVGREERMIELKKEINELCGQAGLPQRYALDFEKER
jgi:PAS domain S-box-containing protein